MVKVNPEIKYQLKKNEEGCVTEILFNKLEAPQRKDVESSLAWTLKRIEENRRKE